MTEEKKRPLNEDRADVLEWRAVCKELEKVQGRVFALEKRMPWGSGETPPKRIVFDAAMLVGDAWRKLRELEDRLPHGWEKWEAYTPGEQQLDTRIDGSTERREAAKRLVPA